MEVIYDYIVSIPWVWAGFFIAPLLLLTAIRFAFFPARKRNVLAFFHPFADDGGGGERVLWVAVQSLQQARPDVRIAIYIKSDPDLTPAKLCDNARTKFNVSVDPTSIDLVPLKWSRLITPQPYPRLTMIGQALGQVLVSVECFRLLVPHAFIDTTGCAFTFPLARLLGCRVGCYVHYPTISMDMLQRVSDRETLYNNDDTITASELLSFLKTVYYWVFSVMYGYVGCCAHVAMVNSSWTKNHIDQLWGVRRKTEPVDVEFPWPVGTVQLPVPNWRRWIGIRGPPAHRVYPPCDTTDLLRLPLDRKLKRLYLVSVAQFRPEKNHELLLKSYACARSQAETALRQANTAAGMPNQDDSEFETTLEGAEAVLQSTLQVVGGCRNADDEARLDSLKALADRLGVAPYVQFRVNLPYADLKRLLGEAVCGLHTMTDEHFGISIVEYMAAGLVPIANNSGGPRTDIVTPDLPPASESGRQDGASTPNPYNARAAGKAVEKGIEILRMDAERTVRGALDQGDDGQGGSLGGTVSPSLCPLQVGFLASTESEYSQAIWDVLSMTQEERLQVAAAARRKATQFSNERFAEGFVSVLESILPAVPPSSRPQKRSEEAKRGGDGSMPGSGKRNTAKKGN